MNQRPEHHLSEEGSKHDSSWRIMQIMFVGGGEFHPLPSPF